MRSFLGLMMVILALGCGGNAQPAVGDGGVDANTSGGDGSPRQDRPLQMDAPPATFNDAGQNATENTPNEVPCGLPGSGSTCSTADTDAGAASRCCGDFSGIACQPQNFDGGDPCSGSFLTASCDGPEDCGSGLKCCGAMQSQFSYSTACKAACDGAEAEVCHNYMQCPSGQICCTGDYMGFPIPSGGCTTPEMAPPGTSCDTP